MRGFLAAFAFTTLLSAAHADTDRISAQDWETFKGESNSRYRDDGEDPASATFEDRLFARAQNNSASVAISQFAHDLNVSQEVAQSYAVLIVETVRREEACRDRRDCTFEQGVRLYDLAASVGMQESSGGLLAVIGMNLSHGDDANYIRLASAHPAAADIFARVFRYNEDAAYLVALFAQSNIADANALATAAGTGQPEYGPDYWSGWYEAYLEALEPRVSTQSPVVRAALAQALLLRKFAMGFGDEALQAYLAYPGNVRALLPLAPCSGCDERRSEISGANAQTFADNLTAALWSAGRREDALALLHRGLDAFGDRDDASEARYRMLSEAIEPHLSGEEFFQRFIIDGAFERRTGNARTERLRLREGGWLLTAPPMRGPLQELVAARARAAGFNDMAAYLEQRGRYGPREDEGSGTLSQMSFLVDGASARQQYWRSRIAAASARETDTTNAHVNTAQVQPWWSETRLPHGVSPWRESSRAPEPPRGANLPMPAEAVVRFEQRNGEYAAVYQSTQYDQPGEIPSYGLWFAHTIARQWQRPIYLGLQSHFPYVPTAASAVPLLDGDTLRIEVQVREIEQESITFPPVGLTVGRSQDGVLLEFSLERLRRDSDGDGFPDIEERRLGLSVDNPDSDGDGLNDSVDPLPMTRYDASAPPERRMLAEAILNEILGHDNGAIVIAPVNAGAQLSLEDDILRALGAGQRRPPTQTPTVFLGADPTLFAGMQSRVRLIVYSKEDLAALSNGAAPFYPPRISNIFSSPDGRTHLVIWTADWVGGTFIVRCPQHAATCAVETVASWIT